jgi:hypothetical protein
MVMIVAEITQHYHNFFHFAYLLNKVGRGVFLCGAKNHPKLDVMNRLDRRNHL